MLLLDGKKKEIFKPLSEYVGNVQTFQQSGYFTTLTNNFNKIKNIDGTINLNNVTDVWGYPLNAQYYGYALSDGVLYKIDGNNNATPVYFWQKGDVPIDISDYDLSIEGTPNDNDTITLNYTTNTGSGNKNIINFYNTNYSKVPDYSAKININSNDDICGSYTTPTKGYILVDFACLGGSEFGTLELFIDGQEISQQKIPATDISHLMGLYSVDSNKVVTFTNTSISEKSISPQRIYFVPYR